MLPPVCGTAGAGRFAWGGWAWSPYGYWRALCHASRSAVVSTLPGARPSWATWTLVRLPPLCGRGAASGRGAAAWGGRDAGLFAQCWRRLPPPCQAWCYSTAAEPLQLAHVHVQFQAHMRAGMGRRPRWRVVRAGCAGWCAGWCAESAVRSRLAVSAGARRLLRPRAHRRADEPAV
jgi:hypothetical protein